MHTAGSGCRTRPTVDYAYDGLDRQTSRTTAAAGTTTFGYDGLDATVSQRKTTNTTGKATTTSYRLDPDGKPLTAVTSGSPDETLFDDGTGSIGLITTGNPVVRCVARYDAYGNPDGNTNTAPAGSCASGAATADTFYRSNRKDVDAGNYQLGSRTYSAANVSFLTPDSYRTASSGADLSVRVDPLTRNTYGYVNGDPINLSDPSGHRVDDENGRACDRRCAANWEALGRMRGRGRRTGPAPSQDEALVGEELGRHHQARREGHGAVRRRRDHLRRLHFRHGRRRRGRVRVRRRSRVRSRPRRA
jgi:RHS repeat-associated protein